MRNKVLKLITLISLIFLLPDLMAQNCVAASGGEASGSGGTVSYTIGQVFYRINSGSYGTVTEGVQQPAEIFVITGIIKTDIMLKVSVFPNPAKLFVILKVDDEKIEKFRYQLYDIDGKLLIAKNVTESETSIDISMLKSSVYFLKIINSNREEKTFKIIKN
jgi:hypothetical protein